MNPTHGEDGAGGQKMPGQPKKSNMAGLLIAGVIITFIFNLAAGKMAAGQKTQIEYGQFIQLVETGLVRQVQIDNQQIAFTLNEGANQNTLREILRLPAGADGPGERKLPGGQVFYTGLLEDPALTERLLKNSVAFSKPIVQPNPIRDF
ncbi:MAG: ATP-dependent metallopeptidase FtsH/Yme1/Tma family protein, partial [Treponema sp.]|nr:ATP-dependent metallopeptidase FtsH/Yme1/Tma family protein [Treponema sp.]